MSLIRLLDAVLHLNKDSNIPKGLSSLNLRSILLPSLALTSKGNNGLQSTWMHSLLHLGLGGF